MARIDNLREDDVSHTEYQVVIIGAGPAGLTAAIWMARFGVSTLVVDSKSERVLRGHADALEPRTWEILESFGLATPLWAIANRTNELCVWTGNAEEGITRQTRRSNAAVGISPYTEATLHQGYIEETLLNDLKNYPNVRVLRNTHPVDMQVKDHSVEITFETQSISTEDEPRIQVCVADYLIGCDGSHSWTRKKLGIPFEGERSGSRWGVMDIVPITNFPDIRNRSVIESEQNGTIMMIPRERGLVRFYAQLDEEEILRSDGDNEPAARIILKKAAKIMSPYKLNFRKCDWSSCYEVAQRLAARTSAHGRVFLCGDAIHNISPKAGMGMNASMQDAYNLGWKIGSVVNGSAPAALLETYEAERAPVGAALVSFDRGFSKHFIDFGKVCEAFNDAIDDEHSLISGVFVNYMRVAPRSWAGFKRRRGSIAENDDQDCLVLGRRIPDVQVVSQADGTATSTHRILKSTGHWRLLIFAGDIARDSMAMANVGELCHEIEKSEMEKMDNIQLLTIHSSPRTMVNALELPRPLVPYNDDMGYAIYTVYADDVSYHDGHGEAYKTMFKNYEHCQSQGRLALIRPDMHVVYVGPLEGFLEAKEIFCGRP